MNMGKKKTCLGLQHHRACWSGWVAGISPWLSTHGPATRAGVGSGRGTLDSLVSYTRNEHVTGKTYPLKLYHIYIYIYIKYITVNDIYSGRGCFSSIPKKINSRQTHNILICINICRIMTKSLGWSGTFCPTDARSSSAVACMAQEWTSRVVVTRVSL